MSSHPYDWGDPPYKDPLSDYNRRVKDLEEQKLNPSNTQQDLFKAELEYLKGRILTLEEAVKEMIILNRELMGLLREKDEGL